MLKAISRKDSLILPIVLAIVGYAVISFYFLSEYFITDVNVYIGLVLSPYILTINKGNYSRRYFLPTVVFLSLSFLIPIKTMFFLTIVFGSLFLVESTIGKTGYYAMFLLLIISPIFNYFNNAIGFPIRLWLSELAGRVIQAVGKKTEVIGNLIIVNGSEFSVDPACAGLQMMATSFIIGLFVLAYYQKKRAKPFSLLFVLSILCGTFVLNVIANLIRIVLLVLFDIKAESGFHDIVGICCLLLYVLFPLIQCVHYFSKRDQSLANSIDKVHLPTCVNKSLWMNVFLLAFIILSGIQLKNNVSHTISIETSCSIPGFEKEILKSGIVKLSKKDALVYVKPLPFYAAEHNPLICWKGSGYEFKQINKKTVANILVYTGVLQNGRDRLYTAWWFDNGKFKTIEQLKWRWQACKGNESFSLINVTGSSEKGVEAEIEQLISQNIFN